NAGMAFKSNPPRVGFAISLILHCAKPSRAFFPLYARVLSHSGHFHSVVAYSPRPEPSARDLLRSHWEIHHHILYEFFLTPHQAIGKIPPTFWALGHEGCWRLAARQSAKAVAR